MDQENLRNQTIQVQTKYTSHSLQNEGPVENGIEENTKLILEENNDATNLSSEQLEIKVQELQNATTSKEILSFLSSLIVNNNKQGIALSWNRAMKVLKANNLINENYKPFSQLKISEKNELIDLVTTIMDPTIIADLKTSILEGFIDTKYYKKRKSNKWENNLDISMRNLENIHYSNIDQIFLDDSNSTQTPKQLIKQNVKTKLSHYEMNSNFLSKEEELINEKIKNLKVERLRSAINDVTSWSQLSHDAKQRIMLEYERLILN